jgi:hypothetical protein
VPCHCDHRGVTIKVHDHELAARTVGAAPHLVGGWNSADDDAIRPASITLARKRRQGLERRVVAPPYPRSRPRSRRIAARRSIRGRRRRTPTKCSPRQGTPIATPIIVDVSTRAGALSAAHRQRHTLARNLFDRDPGQPGEVAADSGSSSASRGWRGHIDRTDPRSTHQTLLDRRLVVGELAPDHPSARRPRAPSHATPRRRRPSPSASSDAPVGSSDQRVR